jgi:hypothetical protein
MAGSAPSRAGEKIPDKTVAGRILKKNDECQRKKMRDALFVLPRPTMG